MGDVEDSRHHRVTLSPGQKGTTLHAYCTLVQLAAQKSTALKLFTYNVQPLSAKSKPNTKMIYLHDNGGQVKQMELINALPSSMGWEILNTDLHL